MSMRLKVSEDVIPITDLRQNSAEVLARVRKSKRPVIITQRGRSAAVLEDVVEYEKRLERLELLEAVARGDRASQRGDLIPHKEAMRRLREAAGE